MSPEGGATYAAVEAAAVAAAPASPQQPSGHLKHTAKGSDTYEPAISREKAERRMSRDMEGPMSGMLAGTTPNAQVANASLPSGGPST